MQLEDDPIESVEPYSSTTRSEPAPFERRIATSRKYPSVATGLPSLVINAPFAETATNGINKRKCRHVMTAMLIEGRASRLDLQSSLTKNERSITKSNSPK